MKYLRSSSEIEEIGEIRNSEKKVKRKEVKRKRERKKRRKLQTTLFFSLFAFLLRKDRSKVLTAESWFIVAIATAWPRAKVVFAKTTPEMDRTKINVFVCSACFFLQGFSTRSLLRLDNEAISLGALVEKTEGGEKSIFGCAELEASRGGRVLTKEKSPNTGLLGARNKIESPSNHGWRASKRTAKWGLIFDPNYTACVWSCALMEEEEAYGREKWTSSSSSSSSFHLPPLPPSPSPRAYARTNALMTNLCILWSPIFLCKVFIQKDVWSYPENYY